MIMCMTLFQNVLPQPKALEKQKIDDEQGVLIGSKIPFYDEFGNMTIHEVTEEEAISEEEAKEQYYSQFIGGMDDEIVATYDLVALDYDGNESQIESYSNYEEALVAYKVKTKESPKTNFAIKLQDNYLKIKYATVVFKQIKGTNSSGSSYIKNTKYKEDGTNIPGYTNPVYAIDGLYLETKDDSLVKFKMAGVVGWVDASLVELVPYCENVTFVSNYYVNNGIITHNIKSTNLSNKNYFSSITVGFSPSYLKNNTYYYSYDGHYFYTDYYDMIDDARNNVTTHAVNSTQPFYNYYQFLPMHSQSNYSYEDINRFIASRYTEKPTSKNTSDLKSNQSLLVNEGAAFIHAEEMGVNPILSLGVAINESGWGRSAISLAKNNLFGLQAYDSNTGAASTFDTVEDCIDIFAKEWVTWGYLDIEDERYFGGHLGDKSSGMNVKYASDPYWGEKAAAFSYLLDDYLGKKDYQQYSLGIKEISDHVFVRKQASTSATSILSLKNKTYSVRHMPVVILEETKGSVVEGNDTWYKIYTDHVLDQSQNMVKFNYNDIAGSFNVKYDFNQSYGYVSASVVRKVNEGRGLPTVPKFPEKPVEPENPETPTEPEKPSYPKGDVNGDNKVTSLDYIKIKNEIMGSKKLSSDELIRADVNGDQKVSSLDYILVKKIIMQ